MGDWAWGIGDWALGMGYWGLKIFYIFTLLLPMPLPLGWRSLDPTFMLAKP
ncbi:MAG: hypothetical protein KME19_00955 [Microcoleus vaginatus WJT46-NPBG5]|nr:hypothetical protein [Microcoleus vaginatus WJT46-NPBG5]